MIRSILLCGQKCYNQESSVATKQSLYNFQDVYNLYWEKVYLQCFYTLNDHETAKDLTQDIFRSLWERYSELKINTSIEHYLAKATKFRILEHIRNEAVKNRHGQILAANTETSENLVEDDLNYRELYDLLVDLINRLPKQCSRVFTLSKINGLSNKEISVALNISERAVEHHITKAYIFVRKNLAKFTLLLVFFTIFATSVS